MRLFTRQSRTRMLMWWIAAIAFAMVAAPLIVAHAAHGDSDGWDYRIPIVITNGSTVTLDTPVCAEVNPPALIAGGFLQADGLDAEAFDVAETDLHAFTRATLATDDCWWIPLPQSLLAGQIDSSYLHMGSTTGDVANVLSFFGANDALAFTLTGTSASTEATVSLDDLTITAWPTSGNAPLGFDGSSTDWRIEVTPAGLLDITLDVVGGSDCTLNATLTLDTLYDIVVNHDNSLDPLACQLWVNDVLTDTADDGAATSSQANNDGEFGGVAGFEATVGAIRVEHGNAGNEDMHLTMGPATLQRTQEGTVGNIWTWTYLLADDEGDVSDAVWTIVRPMTSITVDVQALESKAALPFALVSSDLATVLDLSGSTLSPDFKIATTGSDFGTFTGDDTLVTLVENPGLNPDGLWLMIVLLPATIIGGGLTRAARGNVALEGVGIFVIGACLFVGLPLGWYGPGVLTLAELLLIGSYTTVKTLGGRA